MIRSMSNSGRLTPFPLVGLLTFLMGGTCLALAAIPTDSLAELMIVGEGRTVRELAPLLRGVLLAFGLFSLTIAGVSWRFGSRAERWLSRSALALDSAPVPPGREWRRWVVVIGALVLLHDAPSLIWGYFAADDFWLLNDDLHLSWRELLTTTHNDHVITLLRLELRAMRTLFGVWPAAYNAAVLLSFTAMLLSGVMLLREAGVRRTPVLLAVLLCVGWTLWGQFTTGDYILQKYMQIATLGATALWAWCCWVGTRRGRWLWLLAACATAACWMNVSGFYVPCAVASFALCDMIGNRSSAGAARAIKHPGPLVALGVGVISAALFDAYVYSLPQNTGLLETAAASPTPALIAVQLWSFLGTVTLSLVIPFPHHLAQFGLLEVGFTASLIALSVLIAAAARRLDRPLRWRLFGLLITTGGVALMICLGRPSAEYDLIWPAKYTGPAFFWLCLVLACVCDGLTRNGSVLLLKIVVLFVAASWTAHMGGNLLCFSGAPFFNVDASRWSLLREHRQERQAVETLRREIVQPLRRRSATVTLPDCEGAILCRRFPALEFVWGEQPPLSTFDGVLADRPEQLDFVQHQRGLGPLPRGVRAVPSLRDAVSPEFLEELKSNQTLRELVLSTPQILGTTVGDVPAGHALSLEPIPNATTVSQSETEPGGSSDEPLEQFAVDARWSPESRPLLLIRLTADSVSAPPVLQLQFIGRDFGPSPVHELAWPADRPPAARFDLLQLNGYALEGELESLQVLAAPPGSVHSVHLPR